MSEKINLLTGGFVGYNVNAGKLLIYSRLTPNDELYNKVQLLIVEDMADQIVNRVLRNHATATNRLRPLIGRWLGIDFSYIENVPDTSQETILEKQGVAAEKVQRLTDIVQDMKDYLQKKRDKRAATKALRNDMKFDLYQVLMKAPSPRRTYHARVERARKNIVLTLLYYTRIRVNELRKITYNDLMGLI